MLCTERTEIKKRLHYSLAGHRSIAIDPPPPHEITVGTFHLGSTSSIVSGTRPSGRQRAVPSVVRIFGGINNGIQLPIAPPLHPPHPPQPQRFNKYRQRRTEGGGGGHQAGKDGEDAHGLCRIVMCLTRRYVTENRASQARAAPYGKIPSASLYLLVVCISIGTNTTYGLAIKTSKH